MRKLAVKRLTASDLTLFEWHFRTHNAGNQKALNLNADVFIAELYPSLPSDPTAKTGRIPLDLFIYGPGVQEELNLQRKIVKTGTYKNWRLDGEYIFNPPGNPERFNVLKPGDLVVLEFYGDLLPTSARAVFVSKGVPVDLSLHLVLDAALGSRSMVPLTVSRLTTLIETANPVVEHPVRELVLGAALEDAVFNGEQGVRTVLQRRSGRRMSREELLRAREAADENGQAGEEFVNAHLSNERGLGRIQSFEWTSESNAIAPHDFLVINDVAQKIHVDAKTTAYDFERPFHVSISELITMRDVERYDLYRVYELGESTAKLRIATNVSAFAKTVLEVIQRLPAGVAVDSVSISPSKINFGSEITVSMPEV